MDSDELCRCVDVLIMLHRYAYWEGTGKNKERQSFFSCWFPTPPYPSPHCGRIFDAFHVYMYGTRSKSKKLLRD